MHIRSTLAAVLVAGLGAAGCTTPQTATPPPTSTATSSPTVSAPSSSPTASATPTPSPSQTLDANQAAAEAAVRGFTAVSTRLATSPASFKEAEIQRAFERYTGGDMTAASVGYVMGLRKKGHRQAGAISLGSIAVTDVVDNKSARGLEVHVTVCQDQTAVRVVDKAGQVVVAEQPPAFNLRQYSVRKPQKATAWRIYGVMTVEGECGR